MKTQHINLTIILSLALLLLSNASCSIHRQVSKVPSMSEDTPKATVVIIRSYNIYGAGLHLWPTLNGQDIAALYTKQYTKFNLPEGTYKLGVRYLGTWTRKFKHYEIDVSFKPNNIYYFSISTIYTFTDNCAEIKHIDEQEGEEEMAKAKFIPTGSISE